MIVAKNLRVTSQMSTIAAGTTTAANCFGGLWLESAPVIRMGGGAVSWGSSKVTSYSRSSAANRLHVWNRHRHNIPTACFGLVNPQQVSIL